MAWAIAGAVWLLVARGFLAALWLVEHLSLARGARGGGAPWGQWALVPVWWGWRHGRRPSVVVYALAVVGYGALTLLAYLEDVG
ncbi:MAG: hypothetical protein HY909_25060 [Deltaproteobacteria bacterium]|nr:hypothetical protein [Deltaproteobacteria bacterium]